MKFLCMVCIFFLTVFVINGQHINYGSGTSVSRPIAKDVADEVVVESSLHIVKKPIRRIRATSNLSPLKIINLLRVKRQNRGKLASFGSVQSSALASSHSNSFGPNGFSGANANAQSQGFQSKNLLGGFGASATNTQTQSLAAGPKGIQGAAGASTSQTYNLPNGKTVNVAFSNGFLAGPNGITGSKANSVTIN